MASGRLPPTKPKRENTLSATAAYLKILQVPAILAPKGFDGLKVTVLSPAPQSAVSVQPTPEDLHRTKVNNEVAHGVDLLNRLDGIKGVQSGVLQQYGAKISLLSRARNLEGLIKLNAVLTLMINKLSVTYVAAAPTKAVASSSTPAKPAPKPSLWHRVRPAPKIKKADPAPEVELQEYPKPQR